MKQELDYVRQNSVKVLRRKLRQFTPVQPTFRSMSTYVLWRARRARRLVRTFQRLLNERIPQRSLTTELPNSAEEKRGVLLHMDRYLRTRLALETAGLRHTVQRWGSDSMVTTVEKYIDQLRRVLRVELTQLAETMGVSVPEFNRAEQEAPDMKTSLVLERANRMFTRLREELSK